MKHARHSTDGDSAGHGRPFVDGGVVASRKEGEVVVIFDPRTGTEYRVVVVRIRGDKVKLGFLVPSVVLVNREELWKYVRKELDL